MSPVTPGPLFRRENIKFYEYLWVILGAIVATALYDISKPDRDLKWWIFLLSSSWASICSFHIYRTLDEKWQIALREYKHALRAYDKELFEMEEVGRLSSWFYAGGLAAITAFITCFIL